MFVKVELNNNMNFAKEVIEKGGIVYTTPEDRRIGKTSFIIAHAVRTGKTIVVHSHNKRRDLIKRCKDNGYTHIPEIIVSDNEGTFNDGYSNPNGLLIDEAIHRDTYDRLRMFGINEIAGFLDENRWA